jgi:hypothetical protein
MTVTVTDLTSGEAASRSRAFDARAWRRGTTMVTALPVNGAATRR